jgi:hypothetical protein
MNEAGKATGITPGKEIFVDRKKIPFLNQESAEEKDQLDDQSPNINNNPAHENNPPLLGGFDAEKPKSKNNLSKKEIKEIEDEIKATQRKDILIRTLYNYGINDNFGIRVANAAYEAFYNRSQEHIDELKKIFSELNQNERSAEVAQLVTEWGNDLPKNVHKYVETRYVEPNGSMTSEGLRRGAYLYKLRNTLQNGLGISDDEFLNAIMEEAYDWYKLFPEYETRGSLGYRLDSLKLKGFSMETDLLRKVDNAVVLWQIQNQFENFININAQPSLIPYGRDGKLLQGVGEGYEAGKDRYPKLELEEIARTLDEYTQLNESLFNHLLKRVLAAIKDLSKNEKLKAIQEMKNAITDIANQSVSADQPQSTTGKIAQEIRRRVAKK